MHRTVSGTLQYRVFFTCAAFFKAAHVCMAISMAFSKTKPALGKTNSRGAVPAFRLILPASLLAATLAIVVSKQIDSPDVGVPWQYKGLITWVFFWAFVDAYSIGANDVANAFANAVGAGTVTHGGACLIACVFEIVGAIALGANVSDTIRTKMVEVKYFYKDPYVLSLGMSMVNLGSGLWVIVATLLGLPVSTTHAVVGAVLGVGITSFGSMGVIWQKEGELGGFVSIVASWFISPALSGAFSAIFYLVVKLSVLKIADDKAAVHRGLLLLPLYLFFVFGTIWGFLFIKGIPTLTKEPLSTLYPSVVSLGIGHAILGLLTVIPWLRRTIIGKENLPWYTLPAVLCIPVGHYKYYKGFFNTSVPCDEKPPSDEDVQKQQAELHALAAAAAQNGSVHLTSAPCKVYPPMDPGVCVFGSAMGVDQPSNFTRASSHEYTGRASQDVQDLARATSAASHTQALARANASSLMFIDQVQNEQPKASFADGCLRFFFSGAYDEELGKARPEDAEMHAAAFQRGSMVEDMFQFMQLSTCCFFSLSHGANDVANAVGPFSAVWMVYSTGKAVESKAPTPTWILVYGGLALDIGILTMGHQIMKALGNRLTLQSPSRGFCIELGAMFTVMIASKLGIPVSTTHCITGSTFAVGLCNGNLNAVNWKLFAVIYAGWILTCPAAGVVTGLVYWAVASAPHPLTGNGFFVNHVPV